MQTRGASAVRDYLIKTLNGMAMGLFGSLIIGLILNQLSQLPGLAFLATYGRFAQFMMGPAIGAAVAHSVKAPPLGIVGAMVAGALGAGTVQLGEMATIGIGEPMGAFVAALSAAEVSKVVSGKTKVDIVLVPALTIVVGGLVATFISPWIALFMRGLGELINTATVLHPIPMGIIVAMAMGMILTLPISSAALAISLGLSGLAAGASLIGCCTQMIGFAVISYRENGFGGFIAQGFGTSMIQVPNIIRNPWIWVPPTLASGILGPIGTTLLRMESNSIGAGMGTSGLVGQFGTVAAMGDSASTFELMAKMGLIHFLLPAVLSLVISEALRRQGRIKSGDMKLHT